MGNAGVVCLRVNPRLECTTVRMPQSSISAALGGPISFVGALPQVNAFIVARREADVGGTEWLSGPFHTPGVRGDVIVFASGEAGEEEDLDVNEAVALLRASCDPAC